MTRRLLLVGGWTRLYRKAKARGLQVTVVQDPSELSAEDRALVDDVVPLPIDAPGVVDAAERAHRRRPFDCVVSMRELGLDNAAAIRERLGITGNPAGPVRRTRDKLAMRRHLVEARLPSVPFVAAPGVDELRRLGAAAGWPVILKGRFGTGSDQVTLVDGPDRAAQAFAALRAPPGDPGLLAEAYLRGREVSVESFSWAGRHSVLAVTNKRTTGPPCFVELGHLVPAPVSAEEEQAAARLTVRFLRSIGQQLGPAHTELMLTAAGPVPIESHTRAGGDFIYDLVELTTGVDVFDRLFAGLAGGPVEVVPRRRGAAAIRYLQLPAGVVRSVTGVEEVRRQPGVVRCEFAVGPGDRVGPARESTQRPGWVLVRADDGEQACRRLERALRTLRVEVEHDRAPHSP
jgi:biotin carboxylase